MLAEIACKYFREGMEQQVVLDRLEKIAEASDVAPISVEVALESAKCYMELSDKARKNRVGIPSLFDAIVLGVTKMLKAKLITGDEHFKNLPETLWLG